MPLRLALMVAIGALLALGACSSDTKTVTAAPTTPAEPTPDPDPDPAPTPKPTVTLPAAAATAFTAARRSITVGEPSSDATVRRDGDGNRFRDVNGYRFTCEGAEACTWTILRDAEGMLTVNYDGDVQPGVIPSVRKLETGGADYYVQPASGNWQSLTVAAGASMNLNHAAFSCAAGDDACDVTIEKRQTAGAATPADADDDTFEYYLVARGEVSVALAHPFYNGLVDYRESPARTNDDWSLHGNNVGTNIGTFVGRDTDNTQGANTGIRGQGVYGVLTRIRSDDNTMSQVVVADPWQWDPVVIPDPDAVADDDDNMFAGFEGAPGMAYGAVPVERRLGLVLKSTKRTGVSSQSSYSGFGEEGAERAEGAWDWSVDLPSDRTGTPEAFAFADADMRSVADRWSVGFTKTMRMGDDTADENDDFNLHVQAFTNFDTGYGTAPASDFGDVSTGAIPGTVVAASGGSVPAAAPVTQTISGTADSPTPGTFNGVPGTFVCSSSPCTVTTAGGAQTLTGGNLAFTPTTGAQVVADHTDYLVIGSWAVETDKGDTVHGAFAFYGAEQSVGQYWDAARLTSVQGDFTYDGIARGHYAEYNDGARESGVFAATAEFDVDFDDSTNDGEITGSLTSFSTTAHGAAAAMDRANWRLDIDNDTATEGNQALAFDFDTTDPLGNAYSEHRQAFTALLTGAWGEEDDNLLSGRTTLKFFRPTDDPSYGAPTTIGGVFAAAAGANDDKYDLSLLGAIGATR